MANLTAKQESFIEMMEKSEEHAAKGFELLAHQTELVGVFFDALEEKGFFGSKYTPGIVEAEEPGFYRVPSWPALEYLQAVSSLAGQTKDGDLARKIIEVIRNVSKHGGPDNTPLDNSNTFRKFAEFLGLLPLDVITQEEIDLLPIWLNSRFDHGMVAHALDKGGKGILPRLLDSDQKDDWPKACRILRYCTAIRWAKRKGLQEDTTKPTTLVDSYWLAQLVKNNAFSLGEGAGAEAAEILLERLRETFGGSRKNTSWIRRPAIEDHKQNHQFYATENIFVEGLRDVALGWIDNDVDNARPFVQRLLQDDFEIIRRIGIHVLNDRWSMLNDLYPDLSASELFNLGHLHEVHVLLRNHFSKLDRAVQDKTLDALRHMPLPKDVPDGEDLLKRRQRLWLTAITDKNYQPADEWFRDLSTELKMEGAPDHPDFHTYRTFHEGPGPTPFEALELVSLAEEGKLIEKLNAFKPGNGFDGPTVEALVKALEEAVQQSPDIFVSISPKFSTAKRPYQYGIIKGFKDLWDSSEENHRTVDWVGTWPALLSVFEGLLNDPTFWDEDVEQQQRLLPTRDWIPPLIAGFLQAGTKSDEKAYSPELLPRALVLVRILLERCESEGVLSDDPTFQAINSSKGHATEALIHHALRACRVSDKERGEHRDAWNELRDAFDSELAKCQDTNYEFSTLAAQYIPNLMYLDRNWVRANIKQIFPAQYPNNLICALDGIAYTNIPSDVYELLVANSIIDTSLPFELKGQHTRERLIERITLAYVWGEEALDSPRLSYLFGPGRAEDLHGASSLLSSHIGRTDLSAPEIERIRKFWERCLEWCREEHESPANFLADRSRLLSHLDSIGEQELSWLLEVAPYVHLDHNPDYFITELQRLVEGSPDEVALVLKTIFGTHPPRYDFSGTLQELLRTMAAKGHREDAIELLEKIRGNIPGVTALYNELTEGQ